MRPFAAIPHFDAIARRMTGIWRGVARPWRWKRMGALDDFIGAVEGVRWWRGFHFLD